MSGEIACIGWRAKRVADYSQAFTSTRAGQHRAQKVRSSGAEYVSTAHHTGSGPRSLCATLTFKLGTRIDPLRIRLIALRVETILLAIEYVVSRDCDELRVNVSTSGCQQFRAAGICLLRVLRIQFTTIDVRPGSAIDDELRPFAFNNCVNLLLVGNVQIRMIQPHYLIAGVRADLDHRPTHQSARAGS